MESLMRLLVLCLAVGCAPIDIVFEQNPCTDVVLGGEAELRVDADGSDVRVLRAPVFVDEMASFSPELNFDGATIFVREAWQDNAETGQEVCRAPTVRLINPPAREFVVEWYLGEGVVPDYRVTFHPNSLDE
jgi:hypothetical protein